MHLPGVQTLDEVKASGRYRFLTPDQLIVEIRDAKQLRTDRVASAGWRDAGRRSVEVGPSPHRYRTARAHLTGAAR